MLYTINIALDAFLSVIKSFFAVTLDVFPPSSSLLSKNMSSIFHSSCNMVIRAKGEIQTHNELVLTIKTSGVRAEHTFQIHIGIIYEKYGHAM